MNTSTTNLFAIALCSIGSAVSAQHAVESAGARVATDAIGRAVGISTTAYGLRADGPDYEAKFRAGTFEYTPAFGMAAPHDLPVRFRLVSIQRGGQDVLRPGTHRPCAHQDGRRAVFAYPGGIREAYEVRVDGVEQTFTFGEPLPGRGDLVVRGEFETELAADSFAETAGGLQFASPYGRVTLGAVTGIDANGARSGGSMRFDGTHLELRLPASFVDGAAYPMVLDPLIGTGLDLGAPHENDSDPDVAHDASSGQYCVAWTRTFSASHRAIRVQRVSSSGTPVGSLVSLGSSGISSNPTVANVNATNRFLIAWQHASSPVGPHDIRACAIGTNGLVSITTTLVGTAGDEIQPAAGNEPTFAEDEALLVWNDRGVGIRGVQVRVPSGTSSPAPIGGVRNLSFHAGDSHPAITKGTGGIGRRVVTWQRQFASTAIFAIATDRNLNPLGGERLVASVNGIDEDRPDVAGDGSQFLVVYERQEGVGATARDIWCRPMRYDPAQGSLQTDGAARPLADDPGQDERQATIGLCGPKYVVAWSEAAAAFADFDVKALSLDPSDCSACSLEITVRNSAEFDAQPVVATEFESGSTDDDAMIAFSSSDVSDNFDGDVRFELYSAIGSGGPVTSVAPGCAGGGLATVQGAFALANEVTIQLNGASTSISAAALHIGIPGNHVPCGACTILVPFLAVPVQMASGFASQSFPIECSPDFLGVSFEFQFAAIGTGTAPCPIVPGVAVSNIVNAEFGL